MLGASLGGVALSGCPQLLEDGFDVKSSLPDTNLNSGEHPPLSSPDASVTPDPQGTAGAAGVPNTTPAAGSGGAPGAGAGGTPSIVDPPTAGAGGADPDPPDASPPPEPVTELGGLLAHRYRFDGSGGTVTDLIGSAHGTAVGAVQSGGKVTLSGDEQYVALPAGILSSLENVTIEAWVNWTTDQSSVDSEWQNIFDFGANTVVGTGYRATTHLYVVGKSTDTGDIHGAYALNGQSGEIVLDGDDPLPASVDLARGTQVAFVVDTALGRLSLYVNGELEVQSAAGLSLDLSLISDVNNWLGKSQYDLDPEFEGEMLDVRIYSAPLSADQVALSFGLGPDADL